MKFHIRRISQWLHDIRLELVNITIDIGVLNEPERKDLAATLRETADELDPREDHTPALLEALQALIADRDEHGWDDFPASVNARAAIAKATGAAT